MEIKDEELWRNKKYAIVKRTYSDGSVAIIGGWYENHKYGPPSFFGQSTGALPQYVQKLIHKFERIGL